MSLFILGSLIIIIALILSSVTIDFDTTPILAIWGASLIIHDGLTSKQKS